MLFSKHSLLNSVYANFQMLHNYKALDYFAFSAFKPFDEHPNYRRCWARFGDGIFSDRISI